MPRVDPSDRGHPLGCRRDQLGPPVGRVVGVRREPATHQQIGGALDALPRDAHLARDAGHRERGREHGTENLPRRRGQSGWPRQALGQLEDLAVEPEGRQRHPAQQLLGLGHETAISSWKAAGSRSAKSLNQDSRTAGS